MLLRFLILLLLISPALAADSAFVDTAAQRPKRFSVIPVPVVGYTPETRWVAGAVTGVIARFDTARPSTLLALATYSQNDQFRLWLHPEAYLGAWHYNLEFEMRRWPDSYWGIGNRTSKADEETYTSRTFSIDASVQRKLAAAFSLGLSYDLKSVQVLRVEDGRALRRGAARWKTGPGLLASYDTRDNTFSPQRGMLLSGEAGLSARMFGADQAFRHATFDLRGYLPLHGSHTLAIQGYGCFSDGDVPFTSLPSIGHEERFRGYPFGRFRDKQLLLTTMEYRFPLYWTFRGALFAGAADVSDRLSHFTRPQFKHSLGGGLRWVILPRDRACLRLDFAWGQRSDAFYLSLNEAF